MAGELISREALERIIQRAAELQAGEHDVGDGLTRDDVLALGKEVGIPAQHLHQALLEEQTRTAAETTRGALSWLAGPARLAAARVVAGDRTTLERALANLLEREELLQVKRRFPDQTTWEPKAGAFASLQRALGAGGKTFALTRAAEVAGAVAALEPGFCHVRLRADVRNQRRQRLVGAAAVVAAGCVSAVLLVPMGIIAPWGLMPVVAATVATAVYLRGHVRSNERVHVSLEQVLDRLERGEVRAETAAPGSAGAFGRLADELRSLLP
jgi:hypothetical protein